MRKREIIAVAQVLNTLLDDLGYEARIDQRQSKSDLALEICTCVAHLEDEGNAIPAAISDHLDDLAVIGNYDADANVEETQAEETQAEETQAEETQAEETQARPGVRH